MHLSSTSNPQFVSTTHHPKKLQLSVNFLPLTLINQSPMVIYRLDHLIGHLMKGKDGRFAKIVFYFLRATEYHCCRVYVTGKAVNQGDNKGMKVPCTSLFKGQSEFVDVLYQELKKHV